ncbi:Fe-S cluster assembly protein SufD [Novispirillum sp. DQ9]|uniref:Fe-S cluster assembly protein SufD n=1 Tax=Novispirillum sp. DQ9 TaxID=3398612 RepID=UPI003C7B038D
MAEAVTTLPMSDAAPSGGPAWLAALRGEGLASYAAQGLPGRRSEAWKYTRIDTLLKKLALVPAPAAAPVQVPEGVLRCDGPRLVLVNGRFAPDLSDLGALPKGVTVQSLADALEADPAAVEPHLGRLQPLDGYPFAALNTGVLGDGLVIRVRDGALVEAPLHVISIAQGESEGGGTVAFHPRLLVTVGEGAVATLLESHVGSGETLSNTVTEITVGADAVLHHYKVQNEDAAATHLAATQAVVGAKAVYEAFALSFGARLARHDIRVCLDGEGAEARVNGAYAADSGQHMDTSSFIDHALPHCTSAQTYKGVVDGTGRGVFQGRINVRRDAQGTNGHQLHKALLLSRKAEVDTKPELTIYADDVQCSHGATCGELDQDQLFYLRARGLDVAEARGLLIEGFLDDVIDSVSSDAVRQAMRDMVHAWLLTRSGRTGGAE